jgi:RNA polymerase sigma-70 factor (ECF subfamily)
LYAKEESIDCISNDMGMEKSVIYNRVSRAKKKIRKISEV